MIVQRVAQQLLKINNKSKIVRFCSEQKVVDSGKSEEATQDEIFKFQREWKQLSEQKDEEQLKYLSEELTEVQKQKVDMVAKALLDLNVFEARYLTTSVKQRILKTTNIDLMKLNTDWPSIKQLENGTWPSNNPNWFLQQEAIAKLWPTGQQGMAELFGNVFGGAMATGGAAPAQGAAAGEAAPAEEEKKEEAVKTNFNLELAKFDAASKIKVIKEVRTVMGLGLKEAKDLVEKVPTVLKSNIGKAEAEELKEKLEKVGCTVNLL